jgi:CBS domain-containing protein
MICPSCGHENIQGVDECENCGNDLRTVDIPSPSTYFEATLVTQPLSNLRPPEPVAIGPSAGLEEAVRLMNEHGTGCLVVEDDSGVRGILSERDLLLKLAGTALDDMTVAQLMTEDPVVLRPDDSIAVAIHKMAIGGFRHIPLVADGQATAIVSARDVFRHILGQLR